MALPPGLAEGVLIVRFLKESIAPRDTRPAVPFRARSRSTLPPEPLMEASSGRSEIVALRPGGCPHTAAVICLGGRARNMPEFVSCTESP